jgi:hypothetical protein
MANNFVINNNLTSGNNFVFTVISETNNVTVIPASIIVQAKVLLITNSINKEAAISSDIIHVYDYQHITPLVEPENTYNTSTILNMLNKVESSIGGAISNADNMVVTPYSLSVGEVGDAFTFAFYGRVHITPSKIDFGIITNNNSTPITIWNSTNNSITLNDFTSINLIGSGVTIDNTSTTIPSFGILDTNVHVTAEGAPQIAGALSLTSGGYTATLSIIGLRAIIFPFRVDKNFSETYSWVTDISPARHGETRISLTDVPMFELSYNYIFDDVEEERIARNLAALITTSYVGLPVWSQSYKGVSTIETHTSFNLSNTNLQLAVGDDVIIWTNYRTYEVVRVLSLTSSVITTENPIALTQTNAYIARFVAGINSNSITFKRRAGGRTQADLKVACDVLTNNYNYSPINTFNSLPIIEEVLDNTADDSTDYSTDVEIYNNSGIGIRQILALDNYNRTGQTLSLVSLNKEFDNRYRSLFYYLKGRSTVFYFPFGYDTITAVGTISNGSATFTVKYSGINRFSEIKAIKVIGNVTDYFNITSSVTASNNTEVLTLSPTPIRDINNITSVQLMIKARLASDSVSVNYKPNIMQVAARTLEVL